jgi:coenzyme F420-dependent glucose-6-phosphate dehydrogenase
MPQIGYALSSEEHSPNDLVGFAVLAEEAGFGYALISDHFHPWVDAQGESPFVWGVVGGIARATERLRLGTGVTCPTMRIHPAIVAHAAATSAAMMPGRFFLGVGTGENLNEHILGSHWPAPDERLEMLEEAVEVIRLLWEGGYQTNRGKHYTVENARLYTLPDEPPEIYVAASQPLAAELAGRIGDALVTVAPDKEIAERFDSFGGAGKPKLGQAHVCWAKTEVEARRTAHEIWPNGGLQGPSPRSCLFLNTSSKQRRPSPRTMSPNPSSAVPIRSATKNRSASSRRRATTTSMSTRWDPTSRVSWTSTRAMSCPSSRRDARRAGPVLEQKQGRYKAPRARGRSSAG